MQLHIDEGPSSHDSLIANDCSKDGNSMKGADKEFHSSDEESDIGDSDKVDADRHSALKCYFSPEEYQNISPYQRTAYLNQLERYKESVERGNCHINFMLSLHFVLYTSA